MPGISSRYARRDVPDAFVCLIVGQGRPASVVTEERDDGGQGQALVAVEQGVVSS